MWIVQLALRRQYTFIGHGSLNIDSRSDIGANHAGRHFSGYQYSCH